MAIVSPWSVSKRISEICWNERPAKRLGCSIKPLKVTTAWIFSPQAIGRSQRQSLPPNIEWMPGSPPR